MKGVLARYEFSQEAIAAAAVARNEVKEAAARAVAYRLGR